jgi:uncharacterized GH25 family protein
MRRFLFLLALIALPVTALAHDSWVETNTNIIRVGDVVHIDLKLGNHGNEHRDFKLANKVDPASSTLEVIAPDGKRYDLKDRLVDTGYTPQEGYYTTQFGATQPGLYLIDHTFDKVMSYAPVRDIKSAKTVFLVSASLDKVSEKNPGFDRVLGRPLELVPVSNPVTPMGPGSDITVQLLYKGKPLPNTKVSFIPRGATLTGTIDSRYEKMTDAKGQVKFTPDDANVYLLAAHVHEPKETGKGYESVNYSATLTLFVPKICPCCGG